MRRRQVDMDGGGMVTSMDCMRGEPLHARCVPAPALTAMGDPEDDEEEEEEEKRKQDEDEKEDEDEDDWDEEEEPLRVGRPRVMRDEG